MSEPSSSAAAVLISAGFRSAPAETDAGGGSLAGSSMALERKAQRERIRQMKAERDRIREAKREAAVRLQAHTRGWMARSETRKVVTEQTLQQEMKSAIEGRLSERRARREELIGSLISVQRFIRKTQSQKQMLGRTEVQQELKKQRQEIEMRLERVRQERLRQTTAATSIQASYRGWKTRGTVRARRKVQDERAQQKQVVDSKFRERKLRMLRWKGAARAIIRFHRAVRRRRERFAGEAKAGEHVAGGDDEAKETKEVEERKDVASAGVSARSHPHPHPHPSAAKYAAGHADGGGDGGDVPEGRGGPPARGSAGSAGGVEFASLSAAAEAADSESDGEHGSRSKRR